jgi:hypothetical protein
MKHGYIHLFEFIITPDKKNRRYISMSLIFQALINLSLLKGYSFYRGNYAHSMLFL